MSRLTGRPIEDKNYKVRKFEEQDWANAVQNSINKLGKLEDIEDELGCPLEVIFKVLLKKEGIKTIKNNIYYVHKIVRMSNGHLAFELELAQYFYLKDYQKTWWIKGEKNEKN